MADNYTATKKSSSSDPCPAGTVQLVCVDGVYLGERVESFDNGPSKLVEKYAYVYQTSKLDPKTGKPYELSLELTISLGKNANLRKHLKAHAGRDLTDAEAAGFELSRLVGHNVIGTITHRTSQSENTYANITNVVPLLEGMPAIAPRDYVRAPFWEQRRADYKAGADDFKRRAALEAQLAAPAVQAGGIAGAPPFPFGAGGMPESKSADSHVAAVVAAETAGQTLGGSDSEIPF